MFAEYGALSYWTYLVGVTLIVLVSGPDTPSVLKNSVSGDMKSGYLVACGVFIGDAVSMFLAWAGAATLTKTTPILFNVVRYLDTSYLFYLGSKILYAILKGKNGETESDEPRYGTILKRALILNLTNPKTILFYALSSVQSIDVNAPHTGTPFSILTMTLELVSSCYLSFLIISGAFITQYIRTKEKLTRVGNSLTGLMFVGFAARLATLQS